MRKILFVSLLIFVIPQWAVCDGLSPNATPTPAALESQQHDPRLPPILPGESVSQGGGKRMKVWTTTGAVDSQLTREADSKKQNIDQLSVIVDARESAAATPHTQNSPHKDQEQ